MYSLERFRHVRVVLNFWFNSDIEKMMKAILKEAEAKVVCLGTSDIHKYRDRHEVDIIFFNFMQSSALIEHIREEIARKMYTFKTCCPGAIIIAIVDKDKTVEGRNILDITREPTSTLPQYAYTVNEAIAISKRLWKWWMKRGLYKQVLPLIEAKLEKNHKRWVRESRERTDEAYTIAVENQRFAKEQGWQD